jgi:hypothetical protein
MCTQLTAFLTRWRQKKNRKVEKCRGRSTFRPVLERLQDRITPTTTINVGPTTADLISAIDAADETTGPVVLILPSHTTYMLTAPDNPSTNPNGKAEDNNWYGPNGLPAIRNDITIDGNGSIIERAAINPFNGSPDPNFRLFYVSGGLSSPQLPAGKLTLNDLTVEGGVAMGGNGGDGAGGGLGAGGAIFNQGIVVLNRVTLTNNSAVGGNGGDGDGGFGGGGGMGGNGSNGNAFGVGGDGAGFDGGFPQGVYGGIGGAGGNTTAGGGGGFQPTDNGNASGLGNGGGVGGFGGAGGFGGLAGDGGGGGGQGGNGANGGDFGFGASAAAAEAGGGGGVGGGGAGGGWYYDSSIKFTIFVLGGGGGFGGGGGDDSGSGGFGAGGGEGDGGGTGGFGGGNGGNTFLNTGQGFYWNSGGGGGGAGLGGAIFILGADNGSGQVTMTDCTLNGNGAQGGAGGAGEANNPGGSGSGYGGAIFNLDGNISLYDDTVDGNNVFAGPSNALSPVPPPPGKADGGEVYNLAFGNNIPTGTFTTAKIALYNSILANANAGADLASDVQGNLFDTARISGNTNLVQKIDLSFNTVLDPGVITQSKDPKLGPLHNNGGPTPTMAVGFFTPAFGTGNPNAPGLPMTDQRHFSRLDDGKLDLGAFEVQNRDFIFELEAKFGFMFGSLLGQAATVQHGRFASVFEDFLEDFLPATRAHGTITLDQPVPLSPQGTIFITEPTFTWTAPAGATHYLLIVQDDATGKEIFAGVVPTNSWTPPMPLTLGDRYDWFVQARDDFGDFSRDSVDTQFRVERLQVGPLRTFHP